MEMQDKITYSNKRKYHYFLKKFAIGMGLVLMSSVLLAIPVSIIRSLARNENNITEKTKLETNETLESDLMSY